MIELRGCSIVTWQQRHMQSIATKANLDIILSWSALTNLILIRPTKQKHITQVSKERIKKITNTFKHRYINHSQTIPWTSMLPSRTLGWSKSPMTLSIERPDVPLLSQTQLLQGGPACSAPSGIRRRHPCTNRRKPCLRNANCLRSGEDLPQDPPRVRIYHVLYQLLEFI